MDDYIKKIINRGLKSYPGYISYIRFPLFKKLKPDTKITFSFPLTVFVGANGCGKTSALQALYGCPEGVNTGSFWFSTSIDPIEESKNSGPNRYIYQYHIEELKKSVEVINLRRKREGNPDYWETSKPRISDGMKKMTEGLSDKEKPYRTETRWKPVSKDVIYIDFRAELSAFDKFFNFGTFKVREYIKTKQDFIRHRSKHLQKVIRGVHNHSFHTRKSTSQYLLNDNELSWISRILGKNYTSAKVVNHDFFTSGGVSILFKQDNHEYSEAVAGSGEVAIASCVVKVLSAPKGALVLLDEPEVSLHPGAQLELRNLLLDQINTNGIQVVLTTHSPTFIQGLPPQAIKVFQQSHSGLYEVIENALTEQAFIRIGHCIDDKKVIYVEDDLAMLLTKKAINEIDKSLLDALEIKIYPGGASQIKSDLLINFSTTDQQKSYVFLDGDQKKHDSPITRKNIAPEHYNNLDKIVKDHVGVGIKPPINGGNADNSEQKIESYLRILDTYDNNFYFANTQTPEELIWDSCIDHLPDLNQYDSQQCYKEKFKCYTVKHFGEDAVSATDILSAQRYLMNQIPPKTHIWEEFVIIIKEIINR